MNIIEQALKNELQHAVKQAFSLELALEDIIIEVPKLKEHGDYSTNIAMRLSKELKTSPRAIAQTIVENIEKQDHPFTKLEIAGAGFINMVVS